MYILSKEEHEKVIASRGFLALTSRLKQRKSFK